MSIKINGCYVGDPDSTMENWIIRVEKQGDRGIMYLALDEGNGSEASVFVNVITLLNAIEKEMTGEMK
jgi:hypothetical protein